jgi:copper chaperone NosL
MRAFLLAALLGVVACGLSGPVPLKWGEESCRHCHMTLADRRFGAEILTRRGRALAYDDAGCAAEAIADGEVAAGEVDSVWVVDYTHPDRLIPADSATLVRSGAFLTPMGSGLAATASTLEAQGLAADMHGTVLRWHEVLALASGGGLRPR